MRDSFDDGENSIYNGRGFGMRHIHGELVEKGFPKSKKEWKDLKGRQIWTKRSPKGRIRAYTEDVPNMACSIPTGRRTKNETRRAQRT